MKTLFIVMTVVGVVTAWARKALEDDKIDAYEVADLVDRICKTTGMGSSITVPNLEAKGGKK